MDLPPPPDKPPGYPRVLYVLPVVAVILFPVYLLALFFSVKWGVILAGSVLAGYGAASALKDIVKMREEERGWRETHERYRRLWLRQRGS